MMKWKAFGINDLADEVETEEVQWWLYGWLDGSGFTTENSEPKSVNESAENILAYREGRAKGEIEMGKRLEPKKEVTDG